MLKKGWFINGEEKVVSETYEIFHPHTEEKLADVAYSSKKMMSEAIEAATNSFPIIKDLSCRERADILFQAATLLEEEKEEVALIICDEAAKPISAARGEVDRTIQTLQFSGEEAKKLAGEYVPLAAGKGGEGRDAYTIHEPIGVIGAITPFNFPLNLTTHKAGPAVATGNPIIIKPAEQTPLSSLYLADLLTRAGLPKGAIAVVPGDGPPLGEVLLEDERVKKISFTGSPEVGKQIKKNAGLKKVTLELGSNSAMYVDESVADDLDTVVNQAVNGAFAYNGQVCLSTQRIYVHEKIASTFKDKFTKNAKNVAFGDPRDENTQVSSLIKRAAQQRVLQWIDESVNSGAELLIGGTPEANGVHPTALANVNEALNISCKEVFGPVVLINEVQSSEEALTAMNNSNYGLNAGVFTNHLSQALNMAHSLEVGQVMINDVPTLRFDHMPYGGVKDSGYGREGIKYAMEEMTELKMISLNYTFGN
ncbi:aldehyde dehydrogenase family protein [Texcoconibacillus texcoconensis]|uniref:Acyl-CoA reductase-like NAD-dependent aldehyde dehydrogenase n=1 Tax=Texcoconibacillus texcoconensis TaxID=1095777 RepID=A0A840QU87_9BACI|nr:aldehyde dehydrogenase family protein [Texcoconibacillus texcoconensis]MBB5174873.1 acyl-CoA reductase-like NAD-dependent aldehyde dehydrogenase [Texcoconibacillus texcoconensis]